MSARKNPSRQYRYWPSYCEENIWYLCEEHLSDHKARVAFISNPRREVALWGQKLASSLREPVIWDYHVILISISQNGWQIWDFDTLFGFPVAAKDYLDLTFPRGSTIPYSPLFRLLRTVEFRRELRSDRSHMRRPDGSFLSAPPPWPPIGSESSTNLDRFIDLEKKFLGEVLSLDELRLRLASRDG